MEQVAASESERGQLVLRRREDGTLEVMVTDDGRPSTPAGETGAGLGIPGMRSRVEALGGTLEAGPLPDRGFRVRAVLPLRDGSGPAAGAGG